MFELLQKEFGYYYCVTTTMLRTLARKALLPAVHSIKFFLCIRTIIKHRLHPVKLRNCLAPPERVWRRRKDCCHTSLRKEVGTNVY